MNVYGAMAGPDIHYRRAEDNANVRTTSEDILGKDDFLKLLVTQLANQDPLDPVADQEFIAQLAQFSALEQMQNVSKGIEELAELQFWLGGMGQAASLVGRTVVVTDPETGEPREGVVEAARVTDGVPVVVIQGVEYALWEVTEVQGTSAG